MANALTVKEHNEDFSMIYDMGCNAVRLAHYPQADYFYELCDQYGVLVWAEIPFVNDIGGEGSYEAPDETRAAFFETTRVQLKELIRQQINHPSIVVWGIHNEVFPRHESVMLPFCEELANLCRSEDGTRLVTQATANASTPTWGGSELICTNLYPGFYYGKYTELTNYINTFRSQVGGRPVGISEYGCGANYEHHCEDYPAAVCSSGDYYEYEEYQSEAHESYLDQINRMDYLWCTFVWNMFDFGSDGRYEAQVGTKIKHIPDKGAPEIIHAVNLVEVAFVGLRLVFLVFVIIARAADGGGVVLAVVLVVCAAAVSRMPYPPAADLAAEGVDLSWSARCTFRSKSRDKDQ